MSRIKRDLNRQRPLLDIDNLITALGLFCEHDAVLELICIDVLETEERRVIP